MISLIELLFEMRYHHTGKGNKDNKKPDYHYTGMGTYKDLRKEQRLLKEYDIIIDFIGNKSDNKFKDSDIAIYNVNFDPGDLDQDEEDEYYNQPYPRKIGKFIMNEGDVQIMDDLFFQIANRKYKEGTRVAFQLYDFQLEKRLLKDDPQIVLTKKRMARLYKLMIASGKFMVYIGDYNRKTTKDDGFFDTAQAIYIPIHVEPSMGKLGVTNFLFNRRSEMDKPETNRPNTRPGGKLHQGQKLITTLGDLEKYITSGYQIFSTQDKMSHEYINSEIK